MTVSVSTDERTPLIDILLKNLKERGHQTMYFGPKVDGGTADWPDVTIEAIKTMEKGIADEAIVCCWTGTGCSIAANKVPGIRAALCHDAETAKGARMWNHANVLALSLRVTTEGLLKEILDAWFSTPFSVDKWNTDQISKVNKLDNRS